MDQTDSGVHQATHDINAGCCTIMGHLTHLIDAAYKIGAQSELRAVHDALQALFRKAEAAHRPFTTDDA